jgi:hypothetical protein
MAILIITVIVRMIKSEAWDELNMAVRREPLRNSRHTWSDSVQTWRSELFQFNSYDLLGV